MRRYAFYLSVALLAFGIGSLFFSSCALAQEKTGGKTDEKLNGENIIKEKDFQEILGKATEKLKGKTYRLTKTEENFSDRDANPESVKVNILEIIPPNKRREVEEFKSLTKNSRTERIWDGKNLYEKENDGEWKKYDGGGGGGGNFTSGRITTTYKFIGKSTLNNQIVNVYEAEMNRIANKLTRTSQYQVQYVEKTKYWISEDGYFLKSVKESEIAGSKSLTCEVAVYEYDQNIKIEAPIK